MKVLTSREEVLPFVHEWLDLLAQDRYEEAFRLLSHPADEVWTPDLLRQLVANYGSLEPYGDGKVFQITPRASAVRAPNSPEPYDDVEWFTEEKGRMPERVGMIHCDVPLNGEWSDLTAIFWVNACGSNYVLQLEDMHVL